MAASGRDGAAQLRDEIAELREEVAELRDRVADLRDEAADQRDDTFPFGRDGRIARRTEDVQQLVHAERNRREALVGRHAAAGERRRAGLARDEASVNRDIATGDRLEAGVQRHHESALRQGRSSQDPPIDADAVAPSPQDGAGDRDRSGERGDHRARHRDLAAARRDDAADRRDLAGQQRNDQADLRDATAERSDVAARLRDLPDATQLDRDRAAQDRRSASNERAAASHDRTRAAADRAAAIDDRSLSIHDRDVASQNRHASASERMQSTFDHLTGAYARGPGLAELEREIARARRTEQTLLLGFVDVDGLKAVNDSHGHAGGDRLLRNVVETIRSFLRPYDVIARFGGDEFLCICPGLETGDALDRFVLVNDALATGDDGGSVTVGLAHLGDGETSHDLIERADVDLYRRRRLVADAETDPLPNG